MHARVVITDSNEFALKAALFNVCVGLVTFPISHFNTQNKSVEGQSEAYTLKSFGGTYDKNSIWLKNFKSVIGLSALELIPERVSEQRTGSCSSISTYSKQAWQQSELVCHQTGQQIWC